MFNAIVGGLIIVAALVVGLNSLERDVADRTDENERH